MSNENGVLHFYRSTLTPSGFLTEMVKSTCRSKNNHTETQIIKLPRYKPSSCNVERRLMTAKDAAALLGLHPQTVYDMAASGSLPSFKIGKSRKFDLKDINNWIEKMKEERP